MLWSDAEAALRGFAVARGVEIESSVAHTAAGVVIDWYVADAAEDVDADSGDMLLFEWGTYDWGDGPSCRYGIVRQLIPAGAVDDDIWQLHVVHHFQPDAETVAGESVVR